MPLIDTIPHEEIHQIVGDYDKAVEDTIKQLIRLVLIEVRVESDQDFAEPRHRACWNNPDLDGMTIEVYRNTFRKYRRKAKEPVVGEVRKTVLEYLDTCGSPDEIR